MLTILLQTVGWWVWYVRSLGYDDDDQVYAMQYLPKKIKNPLYLLLWAEN